MFNLRAKLRYFLSRLKETCTCDTLIWLIDLLPYMAGYSLLTKKINVLLWIFHLMLSIYIYIVGIVAYQLYHAKDNLDSINNLFNLYIFIIIVITSVWWLSQKRTKLYDIFQQIKENDDLVLEAGKSLNTHLQLLKSIKTFLILCYIFHFVNDFFIFIPSRTLGMDNFSTVSCVGFEPISASPNRQLCMVVLITQSLGSILTVSSYDTTLIFLFAHTTSMYLLLNEEMESFQDIAVKFDGSLEMTLVVDEYLRNIIKRHTLVLHTFDKLQELYNASIGISVALYAVCLGLFFVLPLELSLNFIPVAFYCLFLFFLYCFQGQRLTTASEKFESAVYCCGWENLAAKEQKYILLMLKVAQKPVVLFGASVVPIRIYTFASTMQSIYKFVTVFKI